MARAFALSMAGSGSTPSIPDRLLSPYRVNPKSKARNNSWEISGVAQMQKAIISRNVYFCLLGSWHYNLNFPEETVKISAYLFF